MLLTARYVIPVTLPHIENGAVLVRGDRIVDIGHAIEMKARYPEEEVLDFGLAALMPGLIDCHTHLEYAALRGILNDVPFAAWKAYVLEKEQLFSEDDWLDSAYIGGLEALSSGITTVADISSDGTGVRAIDEFGLRGMFYRKVASTEKSEIEKSIERADKDLKDWNSKYTSGKLTFGIAPESLYTCHPELLKAVARYAKANKLPVAMHLAGSYEEYEFIKHGSSAFSISSESLHTGAISSVQSSSLLPTGVSPVEYAFNWEILCVPNLLAIHCVQVNDRDIDILSNQDISIVVCPRAEAKLSMGVAPINKFRRKGINVALGTDSPAAADSTDMFEEMRFSLLLQRALNPMNDFLVAADVIRMSTLDAAKALRMDDKIGSIEPGKLADIIAVDLSASHQVPTHYPNSAVTFTTSGENVLMTMVGGEILWQHGKLVSNIKHDMEQIKERAQGLRSKLRN